MKMGWDVRGDLYCCFLVCNESHKQFIYMSSRSLASILIPTDTAHSNASASPGILRRFSAKRPTESLHSHTQTADTIKEGLEEEQNFESQKMAHIAKTGRVEPDGKFKKI